MATDMLAQAYRDLYDVAILVSGDNDFADALQSIKDTGKHVEVALFGDTWSSQHLRDAADKAVRIDKRFLKGCWK
jgi:uncharacterized LabA/DUF88 family protein